jgi:transposase
VPASEQRAIAAAYEEGVRGKGAKALAKQFSRPVGTIRHIIDRAENNEGDPVTPRGHRKRKLSESDDENIAEALDQNPYATNKELAEAAGVEVSSSTITRSLKRSKPGFSQKHVIVQDPREGGNEWKKEMNEFLKKRLQPIPQDKRIYEDETYIYDNERLGHGRTRKGQRLRQVKARNPKKYILHAYVKKHSVVHWELRDEDAQNDDFLGIVKRATRKFEEGDVLIWDQLGKYGREKNPYRLHWDPKAKEAVERAGASLLILPPSGYYFMPLDLLFNDLKEHHIRPNYKKNGSNMSKNEIKNLIKEYMDDVAPDNLPGFFRARANATEAKKENVF